MIWDIHVHIGERPRASYSVRELLDDMDDAGVDRACVFGFVEAIDNVYPAAAALAHPDRLDAFCMVNPWQPRAGEYVDELFSQGMKGVKLHPSRQSFALNRREVVDPILEACAAHSAVFFAHGGSEGFNSPGKFQQIAADYPGVPIVIGHAGTPWGLAEILAAASRHENLWLSTSLLSVHGIQRAVAAIGAHRLLLATDAPFNSFQDEIDKVRAAVHHLTDSVAILGGNLAGILAPRRAGAPEPIGAGEARA